MLSALTKIRNLVVKNKTLKIGLIAAIKIKINIALTKSEKTVQHLCMNDDQYFCTHALPVHATK